MTSDYGDKGDYRNYKVWKPVDFTFGLIGPYFIHIESFIDNHPMWLVMGITGEEEVFYGERYLSRGVSINIGRFCLILEFMYPEGK